MRFTSIAGPPSMRARGRANGRGAEDVADPGDHRAALAALGGGGREIDDLGMGGQEGDLCDWASRRR